MVRSTLCVEPGVAGVYEEMHKLFSLCDEIRALVGPSLAEADGGIRDLNEALKARFTGEPRKARLVAEDRSDSWNRDSWWYR